VQWLERKEEDWDPEDGDEEFEVDSICFLTGISDDPPYEWEVSGFHPVRHGVSHTSIRNAQVSTGNNGECTSRVLLTCRRRASTTKLVFLSTHGVFKFSNAFLIASLGKSILTVCGCCET